MHRTSSQLFGSDLGPCWTSSSVASLSKKMAQSEFLKNFEEEITSLYEESVFTSGTASLQEYISKGCGELAEGIRTTMKIGDLELLSITKIAMRSRLIQQPPNPPTKYIWGIFCKPGYFGFLGYSICQDSLPCCMATLFCNYLLKND